MLVRVAILIGCCLLSLSASVQHAPDNFVGMWHGVGTQLMGGSLHSYEVDFNIVASGKRDSTYLIDTYIEEGETYATMVGYGALLSDGSFRFRETEIVRDTAAAYLVWCLKRATLDIAMQDGNLVMSGIVYADSEFGPCPPGDFVMRKTVMRP